MTKDAGDDSFFIATKAIVVRSDGRTLVMRRSETHPTNAFDWDLPGGVLEHGEGVAEGVIRETKEETALDIERPRVFSAVARINPLGEHRITIYYAVAVIHDAVGLSWEHDQYKWIRPEEFSALQASERNKEAVAEFIKLRDTGRI